jgi:hypothetical protein
MLDAGGDFADGVIAYEGKWLGAETFVSFDKKAGGDAHGAGSIGAVAIGKVGTTALKHSLPRRHPDAGEEQEQFKRVFPTF